MIRRPPRSTRTDTLFPYTTLFRSAPSANASGSISPTRAEHVLAGLGGKISMILDAGPTERGLESTIVAPDEDHIRLLRPGPITAAMLHSLTSLPVRSEERRVGKEWVSTCRSRGTTYH